MPEPQSRTPQPRWQTLRSMRKRLGISQIAMARRLAISQSALSRWERNGSGLTEEIIAGVDRMIAERAATETDTGNTSFRASESETNGFACARIRQCLGLRQQHVANQANISRTALSMFENGYLDLPSAEFDSLFRVLEQNVQELGYEASKNVVQDCSSVSYSGVPGSQHLEYFFGPARHEGLRKLESQLQNYADPAFRLKVAEAQIERDQRTIRDLTDRQLAEKQRAATIEAENLDHKKHKELLGNFAAAQESLIKYQSEKILALEGNPVRDFGKGVRQVSEIDADIADSRRQVSECHKAIMSELERKGADPNP